MKYGKVTVQDSAKICALHQFGGVKGQKLLRMFPQYSKASVYRHAKRDATAGTPTDKRKFNKGRPPKLSAKDLRYIKRSVPKLREELGCFTAPAVMAECGLAGRVSMQTVRRYLRKAGYKYLQARKKGLLTKEDLINRIRFCKKVKNRQLGAEFWREGISMYLDGTGFEYKTNPNSQARAPTGRMWRKPGEGLSIGCTAKGKKEGKVNVNFMVAISYNKGVVMMDTYEGAITGEKMAVMVNNSFTQALNASNGPRAKRVLMDGCPRQNSKTALKAINGVDAKVFSIPARSPDLNPIENIFNIVAKRLRKEALEKTIHFETKEQFTERVKNILRNFPWKS